MVKPLDLNRILEVLRQPAGWVELLLVLACIGAAWLIDRRVTLEAGADSRIAKIGAGSVNRLIFPIAALVLLLILGALLQRWIVPVFVPIAVPLALALALVRVLVYALHTLFGRALPASERAISFTIAGALLLYYLGVLQEIRNALAELKFPVGKSEISVLDLGRDLLVLIITVAGTLWISGLVEQRLMRGSLGDVNARAVLAKAIRALLLLVGVLFALSAVGVDVTLLSVFGGALGVGIGLGLQKLASNYIAGFTILLDRSVRLGDMITVDNRVGIVTKATARYVVVRGLDGVEAIVPNETLVTTTVLNHHYSAKDTRVTIPVQVSYDSDVDRALRIMEEAARGQPRVRTTPTPPAAVLARFTEHGIELELGFWIVDPEAGQGDLRSAINLAIWKAFRAEGIRIPVPQRDIRVMEGELPRPAASPQSATGDSDR
jgi:small-conductance mechanosensitive channel